jgi:hypothetical protein
VAVLPNGAVEGSVVCLGFLVLGQPCSEGVLSDPLHCADPHNRGRLLLGDELLPGASADPHRQNHIRYRHQLILCHAIYYLLRALEYAPQYMAADKLGQAMLLYCSDHDLTFAGLLFFFF